jgi:HlyD family secretion protein
MNQHTLPTHDDIEAALGINPSARLARKRRRIVWLALLAAAVSGSAYWYYTTTQSAPKISYVTQPATKADVIVTVTATGTVQPTTQVDVGSELSGTVLVVNVVDNSIVKKGDVLASLDTIRLDAQKAKASAQLASAEARLLTAKATDQEYESELNRQKTLRNGGLSTKQELEKALAAVARSNAGTAGAAADVLSAKADLSVVETDLAKSDIVSPINGVVLKVAAKPGQTVAASLTAPVLFTLADNLSNIQVEADVDEADIGSLAVGQRAIFTVDAYRNREFIAQVGNISFSPDKTDGVVTYKTILLAQNTDLALRPGMTTTARVVVNEVKSALTVLNEALRYVPAVQKTSKGFSITQLFMPRFPRSDKPARPAVESDGSRSIWIVRDGSPVEIKIKTGASDGKVTNVSGGELKDGDAVIISTSSGSGG